MTPTDNALADFRQGNRSMHAVENPLFSQQVGEASLRLRAAVAESLARLEPEIATYQQIAESFWEEFGRHADAFNPHSLVINGSPKGPKQSLRHDRESDRLKCEFAKSPHVARLALHGLHVFQARTGVENTKLRELFAIETANLILARVILLRFLEDHGAFGETRYVCNGGVAAFQDMLHYFKLSYAKLLEMACQEGSRIYASAFDKTELDWVFGSSDAALSKSIEWAFFVFSGYDFSTVKGNILTGPELDLAGTPRSIAPYSDLFSPEGRVLTWRERQP